MKSAATLKVTLLLSLVGALCANGAFAATGFDYLGFRVDGLIANQASSSSSTSITGTSGANRTSYSGQVSWVPTYGFNDNFAAKLSISASALKNTATSTFFVGNYEAILAYTVIPTITLEVQGGAETWFSNGGTSAIVGANVLYNLPKESFFTNLFVGYSRLLISGDNADEYKVGVSFEL